MMWPKKIYNEEEMEEVLLRPLQHVITIRPYNFLHKKFPEAFDYWLNIPNEKLQQIQEISNILKATCAMMDDVQDSSLMRRSLPAAHCIFGLSLTLNATYHAYFLVMEKVMQLEHPKAVEIYCKCVLSSMRGQGTDIYWNDNQICPTEDEYKQMSANKSGSIIIFPLMLMQLFSANTIDFDYLVQLFSVYYQIRDDYVNLAKQEALEDESSNTGLEILNELCFCEDFTDGKFSWPIIHSLKSSKRSTILALLKRRPTDNRIKKYLLLLLEEVGSLEYTKNTLRQMEKEIMDEIVRLGGNPLLEKLMKEFRNWENQ